MSEVPSHLLHDQYVIVRDVEIKFSSLVILMVKIAIAAIPAIFIATIIIMVAAGIFNGMMGVSGI